MGCFLFFTQGWKPKNFPTRWVWNFILKLVALNLNYSWKMGAEVKKPVLNVVQRTKWKKFDELEHHLFVSDRVTQNMTSSFRRDGQVWLTFITWRWRQGDNVFTRVCLYCKQNISRTTWPSLMKLSQSNHWVGLLQLPVDLQDFIEVHGDSTL